MILDLSSMTIEKALLIALASEKEAEAVYKKLHRLVNNFVLKEKLKFLMKEEKNHYKLLLELAKKIVPDLDTKRKEKSLLPKLTLSLSEDSSVPDLLELAVESEQISESFYDQLAQEIEERSLREILNYLASMEHGHYFLLKGELELCLRDEQYYNRGDFQYDMVHIGP